MTTIFSRRYIARELDRARVIHGPTQAAVDAVAQHVHLPAADVARIAAEEAMPEALAEDRARSIRAAGAASLGITPELLGIVPPEGCRGCGAA